MRSSRSILFSIAILLGAGACSADADSDVARGVDADAAASDTGETAPRSETVSDEPAVDPDPGVDTGTDADGPDPDGSAYYPPGVTRDSLPDDRDERFDLLTEWLDFNLEVSSGYGLSEFDDTISLEYSVNLETAAAAAELCPTFADLTTAYLYDAEIESVTLTGWIISPDGVFGEADWEPITCAL